MSYHCNMCGKVHATEELCPNAVDIQDAPLPITIQGMLPKENDVKAQAHYTQFKIQPATFIAANSLDYFQGNVIKYVMRYKMKNGREDLEKAKFYIDMMIQLVETGEVKL